MIKFIKKIQFNKHTKKYLVLASLVFGFFVLFAESAHANVVENVLKGGVDLVLGNIAALLVRVVGWLLTHVIAAVVAITSYNDFADNESIIIAWKVVRDFCNMGFILILLIIAFATILRIESYNMKQWLPRLILMAILINFSRTICGVLIDASQIVMMTFVNAFAGAGGNFVDYLQIRRMLEIVEASSAVTAGEAASAYVVAVIFMVIALVAVLSILAVFVMRVIMFWILVSLSPLAFLLMSFPAGRSYASRFWGEFTKYLISSTIFRLS